MKNVWMALGQLDNVPTGDFFPGTKVS